MRIVVDTNVLVSALIKASSPPAKIMAGILSRNCNLLVDERILLEYQEVLYRPHFRFDPEAIEHLLGFIRYEAEFVLSGSLDLELPDPDDVPFVEVAIAGRANALITGNLKHFPVEVISGYGVSVLSPADFLKSYFAAE